MNNVSQGLQTVTYGLIVSLAQNFATLREDGTHAANPDQADVDEQLRSFDTATTEKRGQYLRRSRFHLLH